MNINMQSLELKMPPPAVALLTAGAMWGISLVTPLLELPDIVRLTSATAFLATGVGFAIAGVATFRHAKTTVNPTKPETASTLVCSGVYRLTRNPMYLGLLLVLTGWAIHLSCAWTLVGPIAFKLYIDRFQITPEERVLLAKFGADYVAYLSQAKRWL